MRTISLLPILLLTAVPAAHAAEPEAPVEQASGQAAAPEPASAAEKRICKRTKVTGSLTRARRTCMTQAQWNDAYAQAKQTVDSMVRNGSRRVGATIDPGF